ncbi:MAG: DUF4136 domain-containing protein [Pseudomonadota bacterium]
MILILTGFSFTLFGCATSNKVSQDFKPETHFENFKTFAWNNFSSDIPTANNNAIKNIIEQTLTQQGFQFVTVNADISLNMNVVTQQKSAASPRFGISLGLPIGNHGAIGLGTSKALGGDNQQEGLIIIDIVANATNQVVWRGSAEAIPINHFSLRNERQLNVTLKKLIAQFPPR